MKKRKLDPALKEFADRPGHEEIKDIIDYGFSGLPSTTQRIIKQVASLAGSAQHLSFSAMGGTQKGAANRLVDEEIRRQGKEIKDRKGWPWKTVAYELLEKFKADEQMEREAGNTTQADFLKRCQKSERRIEDILRRHA